eukprot:scaffold399729_cov41-Prasinocladus_malaysianus.AAC.1
MGEYPAGIWGTLTGGEYPLAPTSAIYLVTRSCWGEFIGGGEYPEASWGIGTCDTWGGDSGGSGGGE